VANHHHTIAALRIRNQELQRKNAEMRRKVEEFREKKAIAEMAQMMCVIKGITWDEAIVEAEYIAKKSEEYCREEQD
jgi:hypothetical protein